MTTTIKPVSKSSSRLLIFSILCLSGLVTGACENENSQSAMMDDSSEEEVEDNYDPKKSIFYQDCVEICTIHPTLCDGQHLMADSTISEPCLISCVSTMDFFDLTQVLEPHERVESVECMYAMGAPSICLAKASCADIQKAIDLMNMDQPTHICQKEQAAIDEVCSQ